MEFDTPPLETSEAASSTTSVAELAGVRPKLRKTLQELGLTSADMTWSAYAWGWSQLILTAVIFVALGAVYDGASLPMRVLLALPFGLFFFATIMIGHEALHDAIFYSEQPLANRLISFVTVDCLIVSSKRWVLYHHKEHHSYPNSSVDTQRLEGESFVAEWYHSFVLLLKYLVIDLVDLARLDSSPSIVLGLVIRFSMMYRMGLSGFVVMSLALTLVISYIGLLTHSTQLHIPAKGWRQKQLQNTCDFLPGSWIAELLFAGLNSHAVHHVYPCLPRKFHGHAANVLAKLEPLHYRSYRTWAEVWHVALTHINPPPHARCPLPKDYYTAEYEIQVPKHAA